MLSSTGLILVSREPAPLFRASHATRRFLDCIRSTGVASPLLTSSAHDTAGHRLQRNQRYTARVQQRRDPRNQQFTAVDTLNVAQRTGPGGNSSYHAGGNEVSS
jgi:hypothetical protein